MSTSDRASLTSEDKKQRYEEKTIARYEHRMREFEIRSFRAAVINYRLAADYDWWSLCLEHIANFFGACGGLSIIKFIHGFFFDKNFVNESWGYIVIIVFLLLFAGMTHVVGAWSSKIFPSYRSRAKQHKLAAGSWQRLQEKMKSNRWALGDSKQTIKEITSDYNSLVDEREKVVNLVDIPDKMYEKYEDPEQVKTLLVDKTNNRNALYDMLKGVWESY